MPKLWTDTIEEHRRTVHDAIMEATAALVAQRGLRSVTMSQVAESAGIGRATLYKYFPDFQSILTSWHDRQVEDHLAQLGRLRDAPGTVTERLQAVLETYAVLRYQGPDPGLAPIVHGADHATRAEERLHGFLEALLGEGVSTGELRGDVASGELATYCIHALGAARTASSHAAVRRLVGLTLAGLRSPTAGATP